MRDVSRAAGHEVRRLLHAACASYGARVALVITDTGDLIDGAQHQEDGTVLDLTTSGAIASGLYAAGNQLAVMLGDPDVGSVLQQDAGAQHLLLRLEPGVALVLEAPPHRPLATLRHAGMQLAHALRAGLQLVDPPRAAAPDATTPASTTARPRATPVRLDPTSGLVQIVQPPLATPPRPPSSDPAAAPTATAPAAAPAAATPTTPPPSSLTDETDAAFDALFGG